MLHTHFYRRGFELVHCIGRYATITITEKERLCCAIIFLNRVGHILVAFAIQLIK